VVRVRSTLVVLSVASLVLVGACAAQAPAAPYGAPPAPPGSAPAPELAQFYDQQLEFGPCAPYATTAADDEYFADERFECTRVQVPLDYTEPDGARGEVALLRIPAAGEKIGSLLVNPGGPGGSGMNMVAALATQNPLWTEGPIGQRFDVVGFDPRGVGASIPRVDCFTDAEDDRGEGFIGGLDVEDVADDQQARLVAQRCAESAGGERALASIGTRETAQDLDVLRAVLGDEQLSYLGYSYGTELGAIYAETFPDKVRAMVLDGAVDPDVSVVESRLIQAQGSQQSFDRLAAECAATPDCPLGTDPARATEAFHAIVRPLLERPVPTADGRGLDYDDAIMGVLAGIRGEVTRPMVIQGLTEVAAGRGDVLQGLRDLFTQRGPDGRHSNSIDGVIAIRCMDWPRRTPAEQTDLSHQVRELAPFLDDGRPVEQSVHECAAWPEPPSRSEPWVSGGVDLPPTLTVSVTGDPATPHQGGINLARVLGGSLLTVEGEQHGIALLGQSACVDAIVTTYLIDLQTPPDDARCTL
jgi:pimeloyl-ACP methyl ester carboxylesterase